jgi:hypothetical protein
MFEYFFGAETKIIIRKGFYNTVFQKKGYIFCFVGLMLGTLYRNVQKIKKYVWENVVLNKRTEVASATLSRAFFHFVSL